MIVMVSDPIVVNELPGGRLSTKHVTIRRASDPVELREIGAEYVALADYLEALAPTDPAQVDAIAAVVEATLPAEDTGTAARRMFHGGLRKVDGA